ncbi:MAG TPA: PhzF family phenazine biosynthesis protein [Janthinobacterium sp.]|nr:PhzF family phenazine biosynthesis protein [Janthinobacterium sp.]
MPTSISVTVVNAFVDGSEGGNPAGVVLHADSLSAQQKLALARKIGLSETAFVSRSERAAFKLEFFTPSCQIAHCGHATVAAFSLLRARGLIGDGPTSKETIDGLRAIEVEAGMVFMEQRAPRYAELAPAALPQVLASLGVDAAALAADVAPCVVDTGNPFLLLALLDQAALLALRPDFAAIAAACEAADCVGYYVFSRDPGAPQSQAVARMFAPRYGIDEEAATGTAAGPLACLLHARAGQTRTLMRIEQGRLMAAPSPSILNVRLSLDAGGAIERLFVGGAARVGAAREMSV